MKTLSVTLGIALVLTATMSAHAQRKTVATPIGLLFRYNGDTIWREQDSTVSRTIYRGDTVVTDRSVGGRRVSETTYLILGDSARILFSVDSTGRRQPGEQRAVPVMLVSSSRQMLASYISNGRGANYVPYTTPSPISYCIDRSRTIIQLADTARDLRKVGARTDTTIYVFIGDTTVKRLSPNPVTLGYAMYTTLVGEMQMSVVRKNLASRNPAPSSVPGPHLDGCNTVTQSAPPPPGQSRRIVATQTGHLFRYNTDTIWDERDSSVTRTVFRGDTILTDSWVGDKRRYAMVYVADGDSARMISSIDSTGAARPVERSIPLRFAVFARDRLEMELRSAPLRERMRQRGSDMVVPVSPPSPVSYCIDASRTIVQHADTARDIRVVGSRADTTVYVFRGDTTVARIAPSPRIFGHAMVTTLVGEMHMSLVRQRVGSRPAPTTGLPGKDAPASCVKG